MTLPPATARAAAAAPAQTPRTVEERRLSPALARDPAARRRFVQTALTLQRLRHPHIAAVLSVHEHDDPPGYRVEAIDGVPLVAVARAAGGLTPASAAVLLRPVCAALDALHDAGLRCRWLERDTLLHRSGRVVLCDRGVAAPRPGEADGAEADIHALGALAWTLLTGGDLPGTAPLLDPCPASPFAVQAAIRMALAADPAARPPSASAFLALFDGSWPLSAPDSHGETVEPPSAAPRVQAKGERCRSAWPSLLRAAESDVPICSPLAAEDGVQAASTAAESSRPAVEELASTPVTTPQAVRVRRLRAGWATNAVAALLWVATVAGAGGAIVHYAGGRHGSQTRAGSHRAAPAAILTRPAIPGSIPAAPDANRTWEPTRSPLCAGVTSETAC